MKNKTKLISGRPLAYTLQEPPKSTLVIPLSQRSHLAGLLAVYDAPCTEKVVQRKKTPGTDSSLSRLRPRGFSLTTGALVQNRFARYSLSENQVERAFMPLRSMLLPSHTAKAMGTVMPLLNCVSLASPVSSDRLTTTRQVGPE